MEKYKQLIKYGKRRCYVCQTIFDLNSNNFYKNGKHEQGFTRLCKNCIKVKVKGKKRDWKKQYEKQKSNGTYKIKQLKAKHNPLYRFNKYKLNAKIRKIYFGLTYEDFISLWNKPCVYCGEKIDTIGVDRVDNEKGYFLENIASCCALCNFAKGKLSKNLFIEFCIKVAKHNTK